MIYKIGRSDILKSVRERLERQRILEKDGYGGLFIRQAKMLDAVLQSREDASNPINEWVKFYAENGLM